MEKELQEILNLTSKEALIYRKLIQLGLAPVQRISEATGINKFTLYDILDSLVTRNIVGMVVKSKVKQFYATDPKNLLDMIRHKEKRLANIIPSLRGEMNALGKRPLVRIHEGIDDIRAVTAEMLDKTREIHAYGSFGVVRKLMPWDALAFRKKRLANKIRWKGLTDESIVGSPLTDIPEYLKLTENRTSNLVKNMPTWTYLYDDTVIIISFKKEQPVAVVIEDRYIKQGQEQIFNALWKSAPRRKSA